MKMHIFLGSCGVIEKIYDFPDKTEKIINKSIQMALHLLILYLVWLEKKAFILQVMDINFWRGKRPYVD